MAILALALVVLIVVAVVVAVTGSSTKTSRAASPPASLAPSAPGDTLDPHDDPPTTIPVPQSTDPDASVLQRLAVEQSDVPAADTAGLIQDGNLLSQPTLDVCNGTYGSEPLRTARLQTAVADADGNTLFSSEAVLYNNANGTAEAFTELRSVVAHCPSTPVQSPVGEPTVTTTFNAAPDGSWPQTPTVERSGLQFRDDRPAGELLDFHRRLPPERSGSHGSVLPGPEHPSDHRRGVHHPRSREPVRVPDGGAAELRHHGERRTLQRHLSPSNANWARSARGSQLDRPSGEGGELRRVGHVPEMMGALDLDELGAQDRGGSGGRLDPPGPRV